MSNVLVEESSLSAIGNAIRTKNGLSTLYKPAQMAGAILDISGGVGVGLTVVGGTTQPSTAKENTIWVNTSTTITSYILANSQPSNPTDGMVWFTPSVYGRAPVNVGIDNPIYIYPIHAMQYVSGSWVTKAAKTYINGQWVDWDYYIFQAHTGALANIVSLPDKPAYDITISSDQITLPNPPYKYCYHLLKSDYTDVTNYNTLNLRIRCTYRYTPYAGTPYFGLTLNNYTSNPTSSGVSMVVQQEIQADSQTDMLIIDISSLSGYYYPIIYGIMAAEIMDWWLS